MLNWISQNLKWVVVGIIAVAIIILLVTLSVKCYTLSNAYDDAQEAIVSKDASISVLTKQVEAMTYEISVLQKSSQAVETYIEKKDKALEHEQEIKGDIKEILQSDPSVQDWWDTEIPASISDLLMCNTAK